MIIHNVSQSDIEKIKEAASKYVRETLGMSKILNIAVDPDCEADGTLYFRVSVFAEQPIPEGAWLDRLLMGKKLSAVSDLDKTYSPPVVSFLDRSDYEDHRVS